ESSPTATSVSDFFVSLGDGKSQIMLAGAFGVFGFAASDGRALRTASQTLEALLATGLVVQMLKRVTGRESPSVTTSERGTWRPFPSFASYKKHQSRYHAYPSGHIATTMSTVTVLIENYPEQRWLTPVGYTVVGLVGMGLVNNGWHWYSDLPLGIALGYVFGRIVSHPAMDYSSINPTDIKLSLEPMINEYGNGVRLSVQF
ncbi:MAG: phosphatase PAP2 family protein, partial [Bacteroidota bacterium]